MKYFVLCLSLIFGTALLLPQSSNAQQPWSGIISPNRAADWTHVGIPGGIPDGSWTQCGSTIAAYGSSGSYASPSTIQTAINACGANQYVLLGPGDFYLSGGVSLKSNSVLRGSGANQTRIHVNGTVSCNGSGSVVCLVGSNTYGGSCVVGGGNGMWSCPPGTVTNGFQGMGNWTGGYSQGTSSITLDNVTGIVPNLTPIILDQCDTGFTGSPGVENCVGIGGVITSASVSGGGSGYSAGDTGTIGCSTDFGRCYGSGTATYQVTSVSGGSVTGVTVTNGGSGYTYTNTNSYFGAPTPTTTTSGGGSGLQVDITGVTGYDNGGFFICAISMICEDESDSGTARPARSQSEVIIATAISGSGPYTVTLNHPVMNPNWTSGQAPQAWWGSATITNAGVEDLLMDVSAISASCVSINSAYAVWVKGVSCSTANFFHVYAWASANFVVRDSYFYWTKNAGTTSYGIGSGGQVGNALFENNIIQGVVDPLNVNGTCTGCVFAYNFSVNQYDTTSQYLFASSPMHSAATDYILEEGNIGAGSNQDTIHGPHLADTFFRNYFTGLESNNGTMTSMDTIPVIVGAFSRYNNYLANLLGTAGYHTVYQCIPSSASQQYCSTDNGSGAGNVHIWDIGFSHVAQIDYNNDPPEPNDTLTASSFYRYGNYDVVHGSVQFNSSEVPTGDPNFPNSVPGSNTFPSSFYNGITADFPTCGTGLSFWKNPSTGTCPPYPSVGPDVTGGDIGMCTSGTYKWSLALSSSQCAGGSFSASADGGYGSSNPAMRCYLNQMSGPPDGTGSILSFNRTSCYATDSSSSSLVPPPPTNLTVTVQ
jgi:hypothetical protein